MELLRFIHAADLHLDSPFIGMQNLPTSIRNKVINSTFTAFDSLVEIAMKEKVDFIIIAGDIFDSADRSIKAQIRFHQGLQKCSLAGISCYISHGNHDPLDGAHIPLQWPNNVHIFKGDQVTAHSYSKRGKELAMIYGISYPTARVEENYALQFQRSNSSFSIGVLHTNCDAVSGHSNYAPCTKKDLLERDLDYWALGHIHTRKIIHSNPAIIYPGNIQGRHIGEQGEKGFYLIEIDEHHNISPTFVPVQQLLWLREEINLEGVETWQEAIEMMRTYKDELRNRYSDMPLLLRLIGKGQTPLYTHLQKEEGQQALLQEWNNGEEEEEAFIWLDDFRFEGTMVIDREEWKQSETMIADLLKEVDYYLEQPQDRSMFLQGALEDLFTHQRAKQYVEELSKEEQKEILREAEGLILYELEGERKR